MGKSYTNRFENFWYVSWISKIENLETIFLIIFCVTVHFHLKNIVSQGHLRPLMVIWGQKSKIPVVVWVILTNPKMIVLSGEREGARELIFYPIHFEKFPENSFLTIESPKNEFWQPILQKSVFQSCFLQITFFTVGSSKHLSFGSQFSEKNMFGSQFPEISFSTVDSSKIFFWQMIKIQFSRQSP